jgi:hypothetical protein
MIDAHPSTTAVESVVEAEFPFSLCLACNKSERKVLDHFLSTAFSQRLDLDWDEPREIQTRTRYVVRLQGTVTLPITMEEKEDGVESNLLWLLRLLYAELLDVLSHAPIPIQKKVMVQNPTVSAG